MQEITRRTALALGASAACVAVLPAAALPAIEAEFFTTSDEPWGAFVRGHVSVAEFEDAVLRMIDGDHDIRENAEGWLFENMHDADGNQIGRTITDVPKHTYMRLGDPTGDFDEAYYPCEATDPGAIPITAVMY